LAHDQPIVDANGQKGRIVEESPDGVHLLCETPNGRRVWIKRDILKGDRLDQAFDSLHQATDRHENVIPVMEEHVRVERAPVEMSTVQVRKQVHERQEVVREPVFHEEVEVQRVPVNRPAEGAAEPRYEGDTLIIPIVEEVVVVEKRLMIKEELHIRKHRTETQSETPVTLRSEEVSVERLRKE
jgi:uncharacterized protein (TIGR02271 family)